MLLVTCESEIGVRVMGDDGDECFCWGGWRIPNKVMLTNFREVSAVRLDRTLILYFYADF